MVVWSFFNRCFPPCSYELNLSFVSFAFIFSKHVLERILRISKPIYYLTLQITGQPSVLYYAGPILQVIDNQLLFLYFIFHVNFPNDVTFFVTLLLKTAGFSAASDATRVSVVIGLFKVRMLHGVFHL